MADATQLRIGLILLTLTSTIYIWVTIYEIDVVQRFRHVFVGIESQHEIPRENLVKEDQQWSSDENLTVIRSDFFQYLASHLRETPFPGVDNYTRYVVAKSRLKPLPGVKQLRPEFLPVLNDVTSFKYPIQIQPCRYPSSSNLSVLVVVVSAPNYFHKRDIIRRTWLRHLQMKSDLDLMDLSAFGFIVGLTKDRETQKQIEEESETYGDIIQIEMLDDYYNLTLKAAGLFNWISLKCSQVDFVLKVDDDVYVNAKNLVTAVQTLNKSDESIYGSLIQNIEPLREGKWEISLQDWPWSSYPNYFSGAAVLMPGITIASILAAAQTIPYMPFDDVFFTGLCTAKAGIQVQDKYWMFVGDLEETPEPCDVHNSITWLTVDVDHFNESHRTTENFYNNVTQCIVEESDGTNRTVDSTESFYFS